MKYIIMAGVCFNAYPQVWKTKSRHLCKIDGEVLIARTIRLLKECGVEDIAITSTDSRFGEFGVEWINYNSDGEWLNAFYLTEDPTCYIFGDVYFSPEAIKKIVDTHTVDIAFFASAPPYSEFYIKDYAEPFAFKVEDTNGFRNAVGIAKQLFKEGKFKRMPIAWELWQVIKGTPLNQIDYNNYIVINDYTCDIDTLVSITNLEKKLEEAKSGRKTSYMIHTFPTRMWYVEKYLIPSMQKQGCENISVYVDEKHEGSMKAHMNSFLQLPDDNSGTWHLQDDVIISKNFKTEAEAYNGGIVCAFASAMYDKDKPAGIVDIKDHWFSFPCIRIPNKIARSCAEWVFQYIIGNEVYSHFWRSGRNADWVFWMYVKDYCKTLKVLNLAPNLVDHVDYLIGGSANATSRKEPCRSKYWEDEDLVEELERKLKDG